MFYFNISIKTENLKRVNIKERFVEWGGEVFSRQPPQYDYNGSLIFDEFPDNSFFKKCYSRLIGNDFDIDSYRTFRLLGNQLSEMQNLINNNSPNLMKHDLYKFLDDIFEIDNFAIFLMREEETIDERYRISSKEELINLFYDCLNWESPKGAMITKLK